MARRPGSRDACEPVLALGSSEPRYERRYKYNVTTATATAHTTQQSATIRRGRDVGPTPLVRPCLPDSAATAPARQRMITTTPAICGVMDSSYCCWLLLLIEVESAGVVWKRQCCVVCERGKFVLTTMALR